MRRQDLEVVTGEVRDKPVFRNLMQLYLYDFSEHDGRDPDPRGLFDYGYPDHFLVRVEGRLAGFALKGGRGYSHLGRGDTEHSITEFFVMRKGRLRAGGAQPHPRKGSKVIETKREKFLSRDFDPGFRVELHAKDLGIALAAGREYGVALPAMAVVEQVLVAMEQKGLGDRDHSAILKHIEDLARHEIG